MKLSYQDVSQDADTLAKLKDIHQFHLWTVIKKIELGWSKDEKYYIETSDDKAYVLRLSSITQYDQKKKEYEIIKKISELGFLMSFPVDFGVCGSKQFVYMILTYIEGDTLENVLPSLDNELQYQLGRQAGKILKEIHQLSTKGYQQSYRMIDKKIMQLERYEKSNLRMQGDEKIISFVKDNIHLLKDREETFQHGDFHPGNLILANNYVLGVIDFNRWDISDPYEEFYKLGIFTSSLSTRFCIGQIEAYFDDHIPQSFWKIMAVYVAHSILYSIKWAEPYGETDIENMREIYKRVVDHYKAFEQMIPSWFQPIASK